MQTITALLPFIKIIGCFAIMLGAIRVKLPLYLAILLGAVSVAIFYDLQPAPFLQVSIKALLQEKFLFLLAIVGLILILSDGLERSDQSQRLMDALSGYLVNARFRLIFFPALIGLLPMPGGAVFSAPMVKAVAQKMNIAPRDLAAINYWFRHVWELAWPLYPGIILTVALADIPIAAFISKSWPGVVAMFVLGWFFLLRPLTIEVPPSSKQQNDSRRMPLSTVLKEAMPLLVAIVGAVGLESLLAGLDSGIAFEWGVIAALALASLCVLLQNRLGLSYLKELMAKKSLWAMLTVIAAIFIFKDTMMAAGVVDAMAQVGGKKAALLAATLLLPFLVGMVAGINVAFVGATFPLILGLLQIMHLEHQTVPYLILATFAGFTGVMISPIHICFMLTCQYFGTELGGTWKKLMLPCCGFALFGIVYSTLLL